MKLSNTTFKTNKTRKYLLPLIEDYGFEILNKLDRVFKLGVGFDDAIVPKSMNLNNHLFILIRTDKKPELFVSVLKWISKQDFFEFDYAYDDIVTGYRHMIVLRLPEHHKETRDHFVNSKFSKMYPNDTVGNYFSQEGKRYKMLTKDKVTLEAFVDFINKEYDAEYTYKEWKKKQFEIELPIKKEEEIFNFNLIYKKDVRRKETNVRRGNKGRHAEKTSGVR